MASPLHRHTRFVAAGLAAAIVAAGPVVAPPPVAHGAPAISVATTSELRLEGASNFRDLGGYRTADGRTVRPGSVFRSNKLSNLTDQDLQKIEAAGITLDVDLRNSEERKEDPDRLPGGVRYRVADVESFEHGPWFHEFVPITLGRALVDAYLTDSSNVGQSIGYPFMVNFVGADAAFRTLIRSIAANPGGTVFHCSAGKDRTGWGAAILLHILGVPRSTIDADFLKSNAYLGRDKAVELSWLNAAYAQVHRLYGSMDRYVRYGLRIDQATVSALRSRLLV